MTKKIVKPKSVKEYLEWDLRKVDVIMTKSLMKDICKILNKLEISHKSGSAKEESQ
jgi:hypothetical protein